MDMSAMMAESINAALTENGFAEVEVSIDDSNVAHLHGAVASDEAMTTVVGLVEACGVAGVIPNLYVEGAQELEAGDIGDLKTYTVQAGDSWWKIAAAEYGKGTLHAALKAANGSPKMLHPGDTVVLPDVSELEA